MVKFLKSRTFLGFLGLVFLSLFVWYIGPLIGIGGYVPLESIANRTIAIVGMSFIFVVSILWRYIKARRRNAQILNSLAAEQGPSPNEQASSSELETLQLKMQEAVNTLKSKNFSKTGGNRFIYQLPWYMIIGPPGAGKTTLLSNSGLNFPLGEIDGKLKIEGIGGTRNCDWWFTDQAVLLDTAGRYLTQDSEAEVDKAAWEGFLGLMKNKRPRRPLNGVLVALSMQDILQDSPEALAHTAKTVRTRIGELYQMLGISPPVYLLFTKCDLLAGFSEYFAEFDHNQREQVWGFTLPIKPLENSSDLIRSELESLKQIINTNTVGKMHRELNQSNRENIYSFPLQFEFVQKRLIDFTESLVAESRFLDTVFFRGLYLTSATQTGSAFDQVISNVSSSFGIDNQRQPESARAGKSFFINKLLTDVMFKEAGLAGSNQKNERRVKYLQIGAGLVMTMGLVSAVGAWAVSYQQNQNSLARVADTTQTLKQSIQALPTDSIDLIKTNTVLNNARSLSIDELQNEGGFIQTGVGLDQSKTVNSSAQKKYDEILIDVLLPRLMVRLEQQMYSEVNNSEFLFEALKTYQMIEDREHFDSETIIGWFNFDFGQNLPADTPAATRASLKTHVARLFKTRPFRLPRPIGKELVRQFQEIASSVAIEQRAYNRIKNVNQAQINSFFQITEKAGEDVTLVFTREDEVSLNRSIPLFFTESGYRELFLPASTNVTQALADDDWVLGEFESTANSQIAIADLESAVRQQYFNEYIDTWDSLIENLTLVKAEGLQEAAEFVSLISDADSPLKKMLKTIAIETELTKSAVADNLDGLSEEVTSRENALTNLLKKGTKIVTDSVTNESDAVTKHYKPLRSLVSSSEDNTSQLDGVLEQMKSLNDQLLQMALSPGGRN